MVAEVSKGIGCLYRPRAIRTEGEADAAKHLAIEHAKVKAEIDAQDARVEAKLSRIARIAGDDPDFTRRARERIVYQELEGQANIEAIAEAAAKALPPKAACIGTNGNGCNYEWEECCALTGHEGFSFHRRLVGYIGK